MDNSFWLRLAESGAVIVSFKAYSQYRDGNTDEADFIGLKFGCINGDTDGTVLRDGEVWVQVDDAVSRLSEVADTPEKAFELWLVAKEAWKAKAKQKAEAAWKSRNRG